MYEDIQEEGRVCTSCGKYKIFFCFGTAKRRSGVGRKLTPVCKLCNYIKRRSEEKKLKQSEYNKKYKQQLKDTLGEAGYKEYRKQEYLEYQEKYKEINNEKHKIFYNPETTKQKKQKFEDKFLKENGVTYSSFLKPSRDRYRKQNKDRIKAWAKEYIEKNKLVLKAKAAQYYIENKEYIDRRNREYYQNNTEAHRLRSFNTYGRRKQADGEFLHEDRMFLMKIQEGKCKYCFTDLSTVPNELDHQVPIDQGGSNYVENIAITCRECNRSKGPRTHEEFLEFLEVAHPKKYRNYLKKCLQEMPSYYVWNSTINTSMQYSEQLLEAA